MIAVIQDGPRGGKSLLYYGKTGRVKYHAEPVRL
jgi:hypothetical protein